MIPMNQPLWTVMAVGGRSDSCSSRTAVLVVVVLLVAVVAVAADEDDDDSCCSIFRPSSCGSVVVQASKSAVAMVRCTSSKERGGVAYSSIELVQVTSQCVMATIVVLVVVLVVLTTSSIVRHESSALFCFAYSEEPQQYRTKKEKMEC